MADRVPKPDSEPALALPPKLDISTRPSSPEDRDTYTPDTIPHNVSSADLTTSPTEPSKNWFNRLATEVIDLTKNTVGGLVSLSGNILAGVAGLVAHSTPARTIEQKFCSFFRVNEFSQLPKEVQDGIKEAKTKPEFAELYSSLLKAIETCKNIPEINSAIEKLLLKSDIRLFSPLAIQLTHLIPHRAFPGNVQFNTDHLGTGLVPDVPNMGAIGRYRDTAVSVNQADQNEHLPNDVKKAGSSACEEFGIGPLWLIREWPAISGHASWLVHATPKRDDTEKKRLIGTRMLGLMDRHPHGTKVRAGAVLLDFKDLGSISHAQGIEIMQALQDAAEPEEERRRPLKNGSVKISGFTDDQNKLFSTIAIKFLEDCDAKINALHAELVGRTGTPKQQAEPIRMID